LLANQPLFERAPVVSALYHRNDWKTGETHLGWRQDAKAKFLHSSHACVQGMAGFV